MINRILRLIYLVLNLKLVFLGLMPLSQIRVFSEIRPITHGLFSMYGLNHILASYINALP